MVLLRLCWQLDLSLGAVLVGQSVCSWIFGQRPQCAPCLPEEQKGWNGKAHNRRRHIALVSVAI